ncbi:MAG: hypothetical protein QXR57_03765 [Metallosphaera sp.]|uniref:hypothetical protein n=1 Tax=Metallosphaera sp. TaxID=2020860 RepID=UPI003164BB09
MELLSTQELLERVGKMINSSVERIVVLTGKLSELLAQDLLRKAASGIDVTLITSDLNWGRWLENRAKGYMREEEEKISKEIKKLSESIELYSRLPWIVLVLVGAIWIVLFLRRLGQLEIIGSIVVGLAVFSYVFYFSYKRRRDCKEEITVKVENRKRMSEEYKGIRESLAKKMHVIEVDFDISFSVVISDSSAIITSTPLETESERGYHVITELSSEDAIKITNFISSTRSLKRP